MKRGKDIKLEKYHNYRVNYGTMNTSNNKSIYIDINAWCEVLLKDELDYTKVIKGIRKKIKNYLFNLETTLFNKNNVIIDFDMRESGIRFGKSSYMGCEISLFQTEMLSLNDNRLISEIEFIIDELINDVFEKNEHFKFTVNKGKR